MIKILGLSKAERLHKALQRYKGLQMADSTRELLEKDVDTFLSYCNGVGSEVGVMGAITYHLIPNTIYLLDVTPASDIHDVEYSHPRVFNSIDEAKKWKAEADKRLEYNLRYMILQRDSFGWLTWLRLRRVEHYISILSSFGDESFLKNKAFFSQK